MHVCIESRRTNSAPTDFLTTNETKFHDIARPLHSPRAKHMGKNKPRFLKGSNKNAFLGWYPIPIVAKLAAYPTDGNEFTIVGVLRYHHTVLPKKKKKENQQSSPHRIK